MNKTTLTLEKNTWKKLALLKLNWGYKTMDQVIARVLKENKEAKQ